MFVGPSIRPAESVIEKKKEKLVYISMGTVNNDMLSLYQKCIKAFANTEYQVILSVGNLVPLDRFENIPENISVHSYVDQIAVLQKADVFVSHCGMNSVSESLYFGVPLVMLPQTTEQGGVANRVLQVGAGIKLEKTSAASILDAVNTVLRDASYKKYAEEIACGFKKCTGAKGAADRILQVCDEIQ